MTYAIDYVIHSVYYALYTIHHTLYTIHHTPDTARTPYTIYCTRVGETNAHLT